MGPCPSRTTSSRRLWRSGELRHAPHCSRADIMQTAEHLLITLMQVADCLCDHLHGTHTMPGSSA
jgi:hypothetical protein